MFQFKENFRALALFAHPDDAELSCFGTLAMLRDLGGEVHIAHATNGEATNGGFADARADQALRAAKLIEATSHELGLPDGNVAYDSASMAVVDRLIKRIQPEVVITHFPQTLGLGHQDHERVSALVTNCALRSPGVDWLLHAEPPVTSAGFHPTFFVDVTEHRALKIRAIAEYAGEAEKGYMTPAATVLRGEWWAHQARATDVVGSAVVEPFQMVKGLVRVGSIS